jgi:hypothetical protein
MHLPAYLMRGNNSHSAYEFYSEGPKGRIRKIVLYERLEKFADNAFNLAFGDWDEQRQAIDDKVISNNDDREKILATVAVSVLDFIKHHPGSIIFAEGSTPSRTRLYQIGIATYWIEISEMFLISGFREGNWEPFEIGKNYEAFTLESK